MKVSILRRRPRAKRAASATALVALFLLGTLVTLLGGAQAAVTAVPLGTADSFAVLAGAGITNTGPTTVNGDLGTYPTTTETGTASITVTGTDHAGDAVTQGAKTDLVTAYDTAAGEGPTTPIAADLAGQTLTPGIYNSASSIGLTGALTLDGGGDPKAIFVFQAGSTLTTASASQVNLINGAQSCNVFWQVGSSATLGTGSTFRGTILALTSITVTTGVTIDGRVLARNGAVTLDTDTITKPTCVTPVVTTTAAKTTAPTTTAVVTTTAVTTTAVTTTAATTPTPTTTTPTAAAKKKAAAAAVAKRVAVAKKKAAAQKKIGFARAARRQVGFTG
jgi:type VI secretion system secreted protein VgrG